MVRPLTIWEEDVLSTILSTSHFGVAIQSHTLHVIADNLSDLSGIADAVSEATMNCSSLEDDFFQTVLCPPTFLSCVPAEPPPKRRREIVFFDRSPANTTFDSWRLERLSSLTSYSPGGASLFKQPFPWGGRRLAASQHRLLARRR